MLMKDETWLRMVLADVENQMWENNLEGFRSITKVMVKNAIKALEEARVEWELEHNSQELRKKFHLLHRYLDYLRRFINGVV